MRIQPRVVVAGRYSTALLIVFNKVSIGSAAFAPSRTSFAASRQYVTLAKYHSTPTLKSNIDFFHRRSLVSVVAAAAGPQQQQPIQKHDLNSLRVPELKDLLRSQGLKVGGRKADLIDRLQSHYSSSGNDADDIDEKVASLRSDITSENATSSSSVGGKKRQSKTSLNMADSSDDDNAVTHAPESIVPSWFNVERTRILTPNVATPKKTKKSSGKGKGGGDCIVYWMQRDVRTVDNWALLFATHQAQRCQVPLRVVYALPPPPPSSKSASSGSANDDDDAPLPPLVVDMPMTKRHGTFLLGGLQLVESELADKHVPLDLLYPPDRSTVGRCLHSYAYATNPTTRALAVITDFSPLRQPRSYIEDQAAPLFDSAGVPVYSVDAHNVVPVWHASPKREVGARTLRPKLNRVLPEFLTHFKDFEGNAHIEEDEAPEIKKVDWSQAESYLELDDAVPPCDWAKPGHAAAMARFDEFCSSKGGSGLKNFDTARNDPNCPDVCSNLSPWINYGHVSFQRLALNVRALKKYASGTAAYIEEGIVRRELSDNFVYYARDAYDSLDAAAGWARESLDLHEADEREYIYSLEEFDKAQTHDDLWNAAQMQLTQEGGMHGFLRMYWAKKILEWTPNAAVALRTGLYFNDRYALDGNDPNGFVGVGWSVMGIHDMGWKERPVFGKIRFMNYAGCKRKFKVPEFVERYKGAHANSIEAIKKHGGEMPKAAPAKKGKAKGIKRKLASK